jgi:D-psicose/D-tagatose/L-ribulose 3-epimerase
MKIGICCNMIATLGDGIGLEWAEKLKQTGYDYIELPLAQIMALGDEDFIKFKKKLKSTGIVCRACNNFFPNTVRLTGPDVQQPVIEKYVRAAISRACALGAETIVFGSSGARNVPNSFSTGKAWSQLVDLLKFVSGVIEPMGIVIAIEHLNSRESNIINTVTEGFRLANDVNRDNVRLLIDYYHLMVENEDMSAIYKSAVKIEHIHFANPHGREFPAKTDTEDYNMFFKSIKAIGYNRKLSVEAYSSHVESDASAALRYLSDTVL